MRLVQIGFLVLLSVVGLAAILTSQTLYAETDDAASVCQVVCVKQISETVSGRSSANLERQRPAI